MNASGESRLDRIEKNIAFLLELHSKAAARQNKTDEQIAALVASQRRAEARQDKAEVQMAAIRKLIVAGMKMIAKNQQETRELKASLKAFIDSMRRGGNGSHR